MTARCFNIFNRILFFFFPFFSLEFNFSSIDREIIIISAWYFSCGKNLYKVREREFLFYGTVYARRGQVFA